MNELKLNNGQVFDNYPHLCESLGVKPTKGKGRNAHFKELARYCIYHKEGQKIIIDEVFPEPKPKIDGRKSNGRELVQTTYGTLMDNLIMNFLTKNVPDEFYSFSQIFKEIIPMFNEKVYSELMGLGYEEFAEINNIAPGLVKEYSGFMYTKVHGNFELSLKRLHKQGLITYSKGVALIRSKYQCKELAAKDEIAKLKKCEDETLEEMVKDGTLKKKSRYMSDQNNEKFKNSTLKKFNTNGKDEGNNDDVFGYWNVYSFDLADDADENIEIQTDINKLIILYLQEIHKSIENKSYTNRKGELIPLYQSEEHKISTYELDQLLWNLPENWYQNFLHDYKYIFPDDNPDNLTKEEMKELGWLGELQSIKENIVDTDDKSIDDWWIKKFGYLFTDGETNEEWIPF